MTSRVLTTKTNAAYTSVGFLLMAVSQAFWYARRREPFDLAWLLIYTAAALSFAAVWFACSKGWVKNREIRPSRWHVVLAAALGVIMLAAIFRLLMRS
jgi:hypothetical protein